MITKIIAIIICAYLVVHIMGCSVTINRPINIFIENSPIDIKLGNNNDIPRIERDR